jgi:hypothetical protein
MNTVKCPFCGGEIENDSFYCDQCGEELKVCSSGHGFKKGKICNECGTKLIEAKNVAVSQAQPAPVAPPVTPPVQPQATNTTQVQPPVTNTAPPVNVQNVSQNEPEKTCRPVAVAAEPKYLVSAALNARLELKNNAVIGRTTGDYVDVFGSQGYVSRTHARVQKNSAGIWEIVDLDSANGTFLNEQKLASNQPATFKIGDTITFYNIKFLVSE